jgi:uncharacterized protein (DUF342 family)
MADSASNAPATKADVIALEERLRTDMASLEGRLRTDMASLEERLRTDMASLEERLLQKMDDQTEKFRDMQTEMLKAFYAFAETNQARLTATERDTAALKERMSMMEARLIQVEKRLNMPPAA